MMNLNEEHNKLKKLLEKMKTTMLTVDCTLDYAESSDVYTDADVKVILLERC